MWRHSAVISNKVLLYATRHFCRVDVGYVIDINSTREYSSKRNREREERGVGLKARKSDIRNVTSRKNVLSRLRNKEKAVRSPLNCASPSVWVQCLQAPMRGHASGVTKARIDCAVFNSCGVVILKVHVVISSGYINLSCIGYFM